MTTSRIRGLLLGFLVLQACATVDKVIVAEPGVTFSLPIGKTAALNGSATRLTFKQVHEDSRCPANAVCIWEGDAKIEVTVVRSERAGESRVISITPPNNEARVGDLFVRFLRLDPYPGTYDPGTPRAYVAELVIRRL